MKNLAIDILESARRHADKPAMSHRVGSDWQDISYAQMADRIQAVASALIVEGVQPGDRIGIYSQNQPRWIIADYAVMSISAVSVPIYATSTSSQAGEIIQDSGMRMIFAGSQAEYDNVIEALPTCPGLHRIVAMDDELILMADHSVHMGDLLDGLYDASTAAALAVRQAATAPDDLATIIYTSGTTGTPKGVMLDHANFVNQFSTLDERFDVGPGDRSLCFLPLSHVYERSWSAYVFLRGAANAILGNPAQVVNALAVVRPNVMVSAPRLYEKIYAAVIAKAEAASPLRRKLFFWALETGGRYWNDEARGRRPGLATRMQYALADKLVLNKVRNVIGGPKKFLSSGGAPLAQDVEEFFLKIGLLVCQGYGLTETAPMLTCNAPGDFKFGSVGRPIRDVEIRIDDGGEILARGPNVTRGYFNNAEATQEALAGGWFHTGDIGHLDEDGFLMITDRIKDIIVTSGGKNVAPQRIESIVGKDMYIDQLAVVGDRRQFISAIIVPAFESLKEFAANRKLQFSDLDELVKMPEVMELYRDRIREQSAHLAPFEKIKRFTLVARQFSMQAGEITPTLKIRRRVVQEKYHQLIERMYTHEKPEKDAP